MPRVQMFQVQLVIQLYHAPCRFRRSVRASRYLRLVYSILRYSVVLEQEVALTQPAYWVIYVGLKDLLNIKSRIISSFNFGRVGAISLNDSAKIRLLVVEAYWLVDRWRNRASFSEREHGKYNRVVKKEDKCEDIYSGFTQNMKINPLLHLNVQMKNIQLGERGCPDSLKSAAIAPSRPLPRFVSARWPPPYLLYVSYFHNQIFFWFVADTPVAP